MFALEIEFHDGVSTPETLLVRRPHAIIGASDYAHVVIEGAASSLAELRVSRGLGREIHCQALRKPGQEHTPSPFLEGAYPSVAELDLGDVTTIVSQLDVDLMMKEDESPDRAGVRILHEALRSPGPLFPAVALVGSVPIVVSFSAQKPILVGRSRDCELRLESSEVSSEHARLGFEKDSFWVEDLGSTNGTFVGTERVSGRRRLEAGELVRMGIETTVVGVTSAQQLAAIGKKPSPEVALAPQKNPYPCLVANSDVVKPQRFVLSEGVSVVIGRDPASDIWVGAAHVSRRHATVSLTESGEVILRDSSSNGTYLNGDRLEQGEVRHVEPSQAAIGLGESIELYVCCSEKDEARLGSSNDTKELFEELSSDLNLSEEGTTRIDIKESGGGVFERLAQRGGGEKTEVEEHPEPQLVSDQDYDRDLYGDAEFGEGLVGGAQKGGRVSKALLAISFVSVVFLLVVLIQIFLTAGA